MAFDDLFGDWQFRSLQGDVRNARTAGEAAQENVRTLQARLDRLALVCSAMWEILQEKTGVTPDDLATRVKEIDLRDGHADGKITRGIRTCPQCKHANSHAIAKCIYCGALLPATDILTT